MRLPAFQLKMLASSTLVALLTLLTACTGSARADDTPPVITSPDIKNGPIVTDGVGWYPDLPRISCGDSRTPSDYIPADSDPANTFLPGIPEPINTMPEIRIKKNLDSPATRFLEPRVYVGTGLDESGVDLSAFFPGYCPAGQTMQREPYQFTSDATPTISPSGEEVAFSSNRGRLASWWAAGGYSRSLPGNWNGRDLCQSVQKPIGQLLDSELWLVPECFWPVTDDAMMVGIDGSDLRNLTNFSADGVFGPEEKGFTPFDFTPDGERLIGWTSGVEPSCAAAFVVFKISGDEQPEPLLASNGECWVNVNPPVASPDNESYFFRARDELGATCVERTENLYIALLDGTAPPKRLTDYCLGPQTPLIQVYAPSPDGALVAYAEGTSNFDLTSETPDYRVRVMSLNGSRPKTLLSMDGRESAAKSLYFTGITWSPDGSKLLVSTQSLLDYRINPDVPPPQIWEIDYSAGSTIGSASSSSLLRGNKKPRIRKVRGRALRGWAPRVGGPRVSITDFPRRRSRLSSVNFRFYSDSPGSRFVCKLDSRPLEPCNEGRFAAIGLRRDSHIFRVRARTSEGAGRFTFYRWKRIR